MGMTERDLFLFNRLAEAVLESREITFEYRKLKSTSTEKRRLQPYHLAEIDGGWYVIGFDLERDAKRTFAVQRMKAVHVTQKKFIRPRDFKLEDHFAGSFGVWAGDATGGKTYEVKIQFNGFAARVVSERRWHPSQEIEKLEGQDDAIILTMHLTALEDVARWVLGFGAQAEAIAPPEFRKMVSEQLQQAAQVYDQS